jgi:hypothetical protein
MMNKGIGFQSHLKLRVVDIEKKLGRKITQVELAEASGLSRPTISMWMKPYEVMDKVDGAILYSIIVGLEKIAHSAGMHLQLKPEDIIEIVRMDDAINKNNRPSAE